MILIKKGQVNRIPLTLTELLTEYPADFLFKFTNTFTKKEKIFAAENISNSQSRFDYFNIEESTTEDLTVGKISLIETGEYDYVVYQMPISSPPSLNISDSIKILEIGKVHVIASTTPRKGFDSDYKPTLKGFK